jgi:hypothetical protein
MSYNSCSEYDVILMQCNGPRARQPQGMHIGCSAKYFHEPYQLFVCKEGLVLVWREHGREAAGTTAALKLLKQEAAVPTDWPRLRAEDVDGPHCHTGLLPDLSPNLPCAATSDAAQAHNLAPFH